MNSLHVSVLLEETLHVLDPRPEGKYLDCTVNGGGHSAAILERSAPSGILLALDADAQAVMRARERLAPFHERARVVQGNFRSVGDIARANGFESLDGAIMDLGLSSIQLDHEARGFSFTHDAPLDMRYDPEHGQSAAEFLATASAEDIENTLRTLGDETRARRITRAVVETREHHMIETSGQLADVVSRAVGGRTNRLHPATRTFLALRLRVNDELGALQAALPQIMGLLKRGGRLAIISFHSLEDRIVKWFFRREAGMVSDDQAPRHLPVQLQAPTPTARLLTPRPILPSAGEVAANPRARSARLRAAERL